MIEVNIDKFATHKSGYVRYYQQGQPIGAFGYSGHPGEIAWIHSVGIDTKYRNQRHCQTMLKEFIDSPFGSSFKMMELSVKKDNFPAIRAYKKVGFAIIGTYEGNPDSYVMRKTNNLGGRNGISSIAGI